MHGYYWFSPPILILVKSFWVPDLFTSIKQPILSRLENELDPRLGYHNLSHTLDVVEQAEVIAKQEKVNDKNDILLLKTAAVFHDSGFLVVYKNHEEKSCEIAAESLKNIFSEEDIKKICGMIMATKIPQHPTTLLEKIVADADLEYLGTDLFYPISQNLMKEFRHYDPQLTVERFNEIQVNFMRRHHYHTDFCIKNRSDAKQQHLEELLAGMVP